MKYYAVKNGRKPGIYTTWNECKDNVNKFPGAIFHSFKTLEKAEKYLLESNSVDIIIKDIKIPNCDDHTIKSLEQFNKPICPNSEKIPFAFVDGSYNVKTNTYGFGGFLNINEKIIYIKGFGNETQMAIMRNVAGEILGAYEAVRIAIENDVKELHIYYDYLGIEKWATDEWRRNKKETKDYYKFMQSVKDKIDITFVKITAHTGIEGNEIADQLAKEAVGILPHGTYGNNLQIESILR